THEPWERDRLSRDRHVEVDLRDPRLEIRRHLLLLLAEGAHDFARVEPDDRERARAVLGGGREVVAADARARRVVRVDRHAAVRARSRLRATGAERACATRDERAAGAARQEGDRDFPWARATRGVEEQGRDGRSASAVPEQVLVALVPRELPEKA